MDDTLIIVSLEPVRMVTNTIASHREAPEKSGHHNVPGRNQEVSGSFTVSVNVSYVNME